MKQPIFYTEIIEDEGIPEAHVHQTAQRLGYVLTKFEGWTNAELTRGHPRYEETRSNKQAILEIVDACKLSDGKNYWCPVVHHAQLPTGRNFLEDEEAMALLHNLTGETGADL